MGLTCSLRVLGRVGAPALRALGPRVIRAGAAVVAMLLAAPDFGAQDFPPPIAPQSDRDTGAGPPATTPEAPAAPPGPDAAVAAVEAVPLKPEPDAKIEQKRIGRRVAELIVTPAGFTYHYSMIHLDDQDPGTTLLQPHPELSVPRFFRIDF